MLCLKLGEMFYCEKTVNCVSYYGHWAECLHEMSVGNVSVIEDQCVVHCMYFLLRECVSVWCRVSLLM